VTSYCLCVDRLFAMLEGIMKINKIMKREFERGDGRSDDELDGRSCNPDWVRNAKREASIGSKIYILILHPHNDAASHTVRAFPWATSLSFDLSRYDPR
jgi:hypothetical protein